MTIWQGCKSILILQMPSQKVVHPDEAEELINKGYKFIGIMPNGKVIVERVIS